MKRIKYSILTILTFLVTVAFSQDAEGLDPNYLIPPSPEASNRLQFIEVPVSHYTGLPGVNIPFFQMKDQSLTLDVSLRYHGASNRVESTASATGLGWSLMAGGSISRVVRGLPDDLDDASQGKGFLTFITEPNSSYNYLLSSNPAKWTKLSEISSGCADSEPDQFYFDINGIQGKFSFDWNGDLVVDSDQKVTITATHYNNDATRAITSWELVDAVGNIYTFSSQDQTYVQNYGTSCTPTLTYTSSWYITSIADVNQNASISFTYDPYPIIDQYARNVQIMHKRSEENMLCPGNPSGQYINNPTSVQSGIILKEITTSSGVSASFNRLVNRTDLEGTSQLTLKRLDEIVLKNSYNETIDHVKFDYDNTTNRLTLKEVEVCGSTTTNCMNPYKFSYTVYALPSRFSDAQDHWGFYNGSNSNPHLVPPATFNGTSYGGADREPSALYMQAGLLDEIIFPTGGKTTFEWEPHAYGYEQSLRISDPITSPRLESVTSTGTCPIGSSCNPAWVEKTFTIGNQVDLQVYYDLDTYGLPYFGAGLEPVVEIRDNSNNLIVQFTTLNTPTNTTLPAFAAGTYKIRARAAWLDQFGSGNADRAYIRVNWDEVIGSTPLNEKMAGGMRILRVRDYENFNDSQPERVKRYDYTMDGTISSGVIYKEPKYEYNGELFIIDQNDDDVPCQFFRRMSRNVMHFGTTSGSHIGYQKVTEYLGENGEYGKVEYNFSSPAKYVDTIFEEFPFQPSSSYSYRTGQLEKQILFKKTTTGFDQVQERNVTYTNNFSTVDALKIGFLGGIEGSSYISKYVLGSYKSIVGHTQVLVDSVVETNAGEDLSKTIANTYDANGQNLLTTKTTNSDGLVNRSEYYYPGDFTNVSATHPIQEMVDRNVVGVPLEVVTMVGGEVTRAVYTEYREEGPDLVPSKSFITKNAKPIPSFDYAYDDLDGAKSTVYEDDFNMHFSDYDTDGKVTEVLGADGIYTAYLWGYKDEYVVAKIVGARFDQVKTMVNKAKLDNPASDMELRNEIDTKIRSVLSYAQVTTYTHKPLVGLTSMVDPAGQVQTYFYDTLNRLVMIKDEDGHVIEEYSYNYGSN